MHILSFLPCSQAPFSSFLPCHFSLAASQSPHDYTPTPQSLFLFSHYQFPPLSRVLTGMTGSRLWLRAGRGEGQPEHQLLRSPHPHPCSPAPAGLAGAWRLRPLWSVREEGPRGETRSWVMARKCRTWGWVQGGSLGKSGPGAGTIVYHQIPRPQTFPLRTASVYWGAIS